MSCELVTNRLTGCQALCKMGIFTHKTAVIQAAAQLNLIQPSDKRLGQHASLDMQLSPWHLLCAV
jgi:hypothetical protein